MTLFDFYVIIHNVVEKYLPQEDSPGTGQFRLAYNIVDKTNIRLKFTIIEAEKNDAGQSITFKEPLFVTMPFLEFVENVTILTEEIGKILNERGQSENDSNEYWNNYESILRKVEKWKKENC